MKICNLIFTRYNLNLHFNGKKKITKDELWYKERLELFNSIYISAVKEHIIEDFDVKFNIFLNFKFEKLENVIHPLLNKISVLPPIKEQYHREVEKLVKFYLKKYDLIICTRLDNDDALNPYYTKKLVEIIKKEKINYNCCLYFNKFIQFETFKKKSYLVETSNTKPNVLSFLYFKEKEFYNFCDYSHYNIGEFIKVKKLNIDQPMFLQSIHNKNWGNKIVSEKSYEILNSDFKFLINPDISV
jgi:hypothetical protein